MDCFTCAPLTNTYNLLINVHTEIGNLVTDSLIYVLMSIVILAIVYHIGRTITFGRGFIWEEVFEQLCVMVIVVVGMSSGQYFLELMLMILDALSWIGTTIMVWAGAPGSTNTGIVGFVESAEKLMFQRVRDVMDILIRDSSIYSFGKTILLIFALGLFGYQSWNLIKGFIGSFFRIQAVLILMPFLTFLFAFSATRATTIAGFKAIIVEGLKYTTSATAVAMVAAAFNIIAPMDAKDAGSDGYWSLVFTLLILGLGYDKMQEQVGELFQVFGSAWKNSAASQTAETSMNVIKNAINKIVK